MIEHIYQTTSPCVAHTQHIPSTHINERHHVWPLGEGGPDIADNIIVVCATGHNNIHRLLDLLKVSRGNVPYSEGRMFAMKERMFAKLGYDRMTRGAM